MQDIKTAIIQTALLWEDIPGNLAMFDKKISDIKEDVDIIVLPEMFNTAFSFNASTIAEMPEGRTMQWLRSKAKEKNCVVVGSLLINENQKYYNRLIWMQPDGEYQYYNKKHLFRFAGEHDVFSAGNEKITPSLKGWSFRPFVCYDLRFPLWNMNSYSKGKFEFDCMLFVANWAEPRRKPWMSLLVARAIDNQSYVIGLNRVGTDGKGVSFSGDSMVVDPRGNIILQIPAFKEATEIVSLVYSEIQSFREQFPVSMDWDKFTIEI
jgi:omega-amidase